MDITKGFIIPSELLEPELEESIKRDKEITVGIEFINGKTVITQRAIGDRNQTNEETPNTPIVAHTHQIKVYSPDNPVCLPPSGFDFVIAIQDYLYNLNTKWELVITHVGYFLYRADRIADSLSKALDKSIMIKNDPHLNEAIQRGVYDYFAGKFNTEYCQKLCHKKGFLKEYLTKVLESNIEIYYYKRNMPVVYPQTTVSKYGLLGGKKKSHKSS